MNRKTKKKKLAKYILPIAAGIMLVISTLFPASTAGVIVTQVPENSNFEIFYLDVGQGDSALIRCDGRYMLIDGGDADHSSSLYTLLKNSGIRRLDYVVATHPDADHVGGLAGALNAAKAGIVFCTDTENDTWSFQNFRKYVEKQDNAITVPNAGDVFTLGSARVTILAPQKGEKLSDNSSIVLRVVYGGTSFLFTGDAELEDEDALVKSGALLNSTVLKVGHHGSSSSSSADFLKRVRPLYAVISVAAHNDYGHPAKSALNRLNDTGAVIFRTDENGTVICRSDGVTVTFETVKKVSSLPDILKGTVEKAA